MRNRPSVAAATSNGLGATFFNVSLKVLLHELFGRSVRVLGEVFRLARERAPAVIFLDECDTLGGSRDHVDSGARRELLNTLLVEMDGFQTKGSDDFVLTMGATNAPWDLDTALLSRFERHVHDDA